MAGRFHFSFLGHGRAVRPWLAGDRVNAISFLGVTEVAISGDEGTGSEPVVNALAFLGWTRVTIPDGMRVTVRRLPLLGWVTVKTISGDR